MNENLMPIIERLDLVLNLLAESTKYEISGGVPIAKLDIKEIINFLKKNNTNPTEINDHLLQLILQKLIDDKFVIKEKYTEVYRFYITFEGYLFSLNGGYTKKNLDDNAENIRVEKLEISQQTLMRKLNVITGWVAGATIALVIVELWNLYLEHFSCK